MSSHTLPVSPRRCDCESESCHPQADCPNSGTVPTIYSRICTECAKKMPAKYLLVSLPEVSGE
jgi:hypothetical protein